jgi:S1-C subfamily serine protease
MWVRVQSGLDRGRAAELGGEAVTIGSGPGCTVAISDPDVQPLHGSIRRTEEGTLELIPHEQPTLLDGQPVEVAQPVQAGQRIVVGDVELELTDERPADLDADLEPVVADAIGRDGPEADAGLGPEREHRRLRRLSRRATLLAGGALALAAIAGALALTGIIGGDEEGPDVAALVKGVAPSTVRVVSRSGPGEGSGTGWVVDRRQGLIVTNFHVVNGGEDYAVTVDGAERPAELAAAAPCDDLAIVRVRDRSGLRDTPLAEPESIEQGETVIAVGYAAGGGEDEDVSSTAGVVSRPSREFDPKAPDFPKFPDLVQTDAAINPGNSGGPLIDTEGKLVGVNTAALLQQNGVPLQNVGFAIGVGRVREVLTDLRRRRSLSWLGTGLVFPTDDQRRQEGLPPRGGIVLVGAAKGTPADDAGLSGGAVLLTAIDGRRLSGTMADYCDATQGKQTGDEVSLRVQPVGGGASGSREVDLKFG